ncbi:MAG: hypothetical protein U9Q03_01965 [Patescibacteria group bacterium]|nr:hypothetical protein [Patescibacteria group bacterium]
MTLFERICRWYNVGTTHTVVKEERFEERKPVEQKIVGFRQSAMTVEEKVETWTEHYASPDGMGLRRSMVKFLRRAFIMTLTLAVIAATVAIVASQMD